VPAVTALVGARPPRRAVPCRAAAHRLPSLPQYQAAEPGRGGFIAFIPGAAAGVPTTPFQSRPTEEGTVGRIQGWEQAVLGQAQPGILPGRAHTVSPGLLGGGLGTGCAQFGCARDEL